MKNITLNNYSWLGVYLACVATGLLGLGLWVVTTNAFVIVAFIWIVPFLMALLIHKEVTYKGKFISIVLLILAIFLLSHFFKAKPQSVDETISDFSVVSQNELEEDPKQEDENKENEDSNDETNKKPVIEKQKVIKKTTKKTTPKKSVVPAAGEVMNPTFTNADNGGQAAVAVDVPATIVYGDTTSQTQDQEIQNDVNSGKDKVDIGGGVSAIVDNTPKPQDETPKDESTRIDIGKEDIKDASTKPEVLPDKKPDDEQLKDDVEIPKDNELDNLADQTKSDTDNTQTKPTTGEDTKNTTSEDENKTSNEETKDTTSDNTQKTDENNTSVTPVKEETKPAETKPAEENTSETKTPVSITPVDGDTSYAGDSVQFEVKGDVKSVEGLDGLNYTQNDGYITVETTPGEATVITPEVIGADGSVDSSSVTVNVLF